jgi:hypothetical protein
MRRMKAALVAMIVGAATLTACDQASDITRPVDVSGTVVQQGGAGDEETVKWGLARAALHQQGQYTSDVIGKEGGWLQVGTHYLYVAAGAVDSPTRFTMSLREGDNIVVELHAYKTNGKVVSAFPANTVFLYMTYTDAVIDALSTVGIGYLPEVAGADPIVPMPSIVYPEYSVVGSNLTHFSTYGVIVD